VKSRRVAERRSASPMRYLPPEGKRALVTLGVLAGLKAIALVLIAEAVARGVVSVIDGTDAWRSAIWLGLAGGAIRAVASWLTDIVAIRTASMAKAGLRHRLAARWVARGGRDLDARIGETTTLATTGLDTLDSWYATVLPAMVNVIVIPLLVWARILWADWVSALIVLLTVPLIPIFMILIGAQTRDRVADAADALGRLANQLLELARGLPVLVGLGRADAQIASLREISESYRKRTVETLRVAFLSSLALELIATISVAIVAVFIGLRLVYGEMSLLTGLLALILAPECYLPFREVGAAFHASEDGVEAMSRSEKIIATPPSSSRAEPRDLSLPAHPSPVAAPSPTVIPSSPTVILNEVKDLSPLESPAAPWSIGNPFTQEHGGGHPRGEILRVAQNDNRAAPPSITVTDLTVQYRDRTNPAVDHLSFTVGPGEIVALSGLSGCGKSTALAAISGLLGSSADGTVTVSGTIEGIPPAAIAWVPQHPETFAETAGDEIAIYGNLVLDRIAVVALLNRVEAGHLVDRHPAELSPGELRRVAMARALARIEAGARVLLLDEPTAHLDSATGAAVLRLIAELRGRVTMILVAHDPLVRALADRVVPVGGDVVESDAGETPISELLPVGSETRNAPQSNRIQDADITPGTLRDLTRIVDPWRREFVGAVVWGVLAALAAVALISVSGWLIVRASQQPPILTLLVAIVAVRFFGIARSGFRYLERLWMHDAVFGAMTALRIETWARLAAQGPAISRMLRGERAIDLLIGDIDRVRDLTPRVVLPPVVGVLTAAVVTVALGLLLSTAVLPMLLCAVVCLVIAPWLAVRSSQMAAENQVAVRSRIMRTVAALFSAAPDLQVSGVAPTVLGQLDTLDREATAVSRRSARSLGLGNALVIFSCVATAMAMLWLAHGALADDRISPQVAAVLALTPLALVDPFLATCDAAQQWPALRVVLGKFARPSSRAESRDLASPEHPSPENSPAAKEAMSPAFRPPEELPLITSLSVVDLAARWPEMTTDVFTGLTAETAPGHWLTVTGPSGSGKSTLLAVLQAFLRPSVGTVLLNDRNIGEIAAQDIRRHIAWCPQEAHLFDSSLQANLLLARARDDAPSESEMIGALDQVGLGPLLADLPEGLETRIGSRGSHLSGGQRQRVAIARTLLTRADVLLIDEPAAHLDRESADTLMTDLRTGLVDKIVVLVTHHLDVIDSTDVQLDLGKRSEIVPEYEP
jgi:ATP-binding cassette subfamily C protein CydCD